MKLCGAELGFLGELTLPKVFDDARIEIKKGQARIIAGEAGIFGMDILYTNKNLTEDFILCCPTEMLTKISRVFEDDEKLEVTPNETKLEVQGKTRKVSMTLKEDNLFPRVFKVPFTEKFKIDNKKRKVYVDDKDVTKASTLIECRRLGEELKTIGGLVNNDLVVLDIDEGAGTKLIVEDEVTRAEANLSDDAKGKSTHIYAFGFSDVVDLLSKLDGSINAIVINQGSLVLDYNSAELKASFLLAPIQEE